MKMKKKISQPAMGVNEKIQLLIERSNEAMAKIAKYSKDYFLVIGMIVVLIIGVQFPRAGLYLANIPFEYTCVAVIFFISGLQLSTEELFAGIKSYRAVACGLVAIVLVTPILGMQITKTIHFATLSDENMTTSRSVVHANVSAIGPTEFAIGLQVFFASPATMAIGIVLVVLAGGNVTLALFITLLTNFAGVFTLRPMLAWMAGITSDVDIKALSLLVAFFILTVFIPTMLGRILRLSQTVEDVADRYHSALRFVTQVLLILLTWPKVSEAKEHHAYSDVVGMNLLAIIGYTSILHIVFLLINYIAACVIRLDLVRKKTVVVLCSHKSLAFALKTMSFLPKCAGSQGLMAISCIIAHLTMVMVDSVLVCVWAAYEEMDITDEVAGLGSLGNYNRLTEHHGD